ncbi:MAG: QueT transporter family protein [Pseudoflavonifractor sp.]|nr:QueT transporter family protein [Pseudoflavonifractor sp.]
MRKFSVRDLTLAAMVAALYAVMSYFGNIFGLTFMGIQFRFSEALCVLPFLFPATVPGLFVGCLITNLLSPYGLLDIVVGSAATLLAAVWTSRMKNRWLAPLPPVICNTVLVGFTIGWAEAGGFTSAFPAAWIFNGLSVGLGELGACYVLGMLLLYALPRIKSVRAMIPEGRLNVV